MSFNEQTDEILYKERTNLEVENFDDNRNYHYQEVKANSFIDHSDSKDDFGDLSQNFLSKLDIVNDLNVESKLSRISEDDCNLNQLNKTSNNLDNDCVSYASYESESNHEQMNIEEVEDKSAYINEKDQETQISTKVEDIAQSTDFTQHSKLVESLNCESKINNSNYLNRNKNIEINLFDNPTIKNRLVKSSTLLSQKNRDYLTYHNGLNNQLNSNQLSTQNAKDVIPASNKQSPFKPLYLRKKNEIKARINTQIRSTHLKLKQLSSPTTSFSSGASSTNQSNDSSRRNLFKSVIIVDTSKSKSNTEVLRLCLNQLGWVESNSGTPSNCDIIWQSSTSHENNTFEVSHMNYLSQNLVKINKFPCMNLLLRKGPLTRVLNLMRKIFKEDYDFYPHTWFLPEQFKEFSTDCKYIHEQETRNKQDMLTTFIVKPNDGSQGDGIMLINNPDDYLKMPKKYLSKSHIVQEYVQSPFLIDGLKCDLRIYVVIVSLKPLEIYICDEGLVRFATVNYQLPNESNLSQIFMHLTNYSLNKKNDSYKFTGNMNEKSVEKLNSNSEQGSKRKLSTVFNYIHSQGYNISRLKSAIDDLVVKTVLALLPEMKVECAYETSNIPIKQRPEYFQIIGFDILLTDNLKPMLLEVNCNPSLRIDYEIEDAEGKLINLPSPIDTEIKMPLVLETLKLVAPKQKLDYINNCKRKEESLERSIQYRNQIVKQRMEQRLQSAKRVPKFDLNKCPLLSKPSENYKITYNLNIKHTSSTLALLNQEFKSEINQLRPSMCPYQSMSNLANTSKLILNRKNKSCLRNIYPNTRYEKQYEHLFLNESISDLFISFASCNNLKLMFHADYRRFIQKCNLQNDLFSADNLDIIFYDLSRKWELYNRRFRSEQIGMCFQGFVEFILTYAQLNYNEKNLELNLKQLIQHCRLNLKLSKEEQEKLNEAEEKNQSENNSQSIEEEINSRLSCFEMPSLLLNNNSTTVTGAAAKTNASNNLKGKTKKSLFPLFF